MSTLIIEKAKLKNLKDLIYLLFEDDLGKKGRPYVTNLLTSIKSHLQKFSKIQTIKFL